MPDSMPIIIVNQGHAPAAAQVLREAGFTVRLVTKTGDVCTLLGGVSNLAGPFTVWGAAALGIPVTVLGDPPEPENPAVDMPNAVAKT